MPSNRWDLSPHAPRGMRAQGKSTSRLKLKNSPCRSRSGLHMIARYIRSRILAATASQSTSGVKWHQLIRTHPFASASLIPMTLST